jgi:hypothetical protein
MPRVLLDQPADLKTDDWELSGLETPARRRRGVMPETSVRAVEKE